MDDEAASQQLMSEAHASHAPAYLGPAIPLSLNGASPDTIANTPMSSTTKAKKSRRKQPVDSKARHRDVLAAAPFPPHARQEVQAFMDPSPSKSQTFPSTIPATPVAIPDTQEIPQENYTPTSAQRTSSQSIPTGSSSKKKNRKGKNLKAEMAEHTQEEKTQAAPAVAPKAHKPRRKAKSSDSQLENAAATAQQDTVPATLYEDAVEGIARTSPSTPEDQASPKRRQNDESRASVNSLDLKQGATIKTPEPTQDESQIGTAVERHDDTGTLDPASQPLIPKTLLDNLKAQRLQPSSAKVPSKKNQRLQSTAKTRNLAVAREKAQQASREHADALEGSVNGQTITSVDEEAEPETSDTVETTTSSKSSGASKSKEKSKPLNKGKQAADKPLLDWETPVQGLHDTPVKLSDHELETHLEDNHDSDSRTGSSSSRPKRKSTNGSRASRPSIGGLARAPKRKALKSRADPNRNYQRDRNDDERSAAEIALDDAHPLGQPPDKRTSGEYTADEKELLRRAIRDHQERNGLEVADLIEIIQWNQARKGEMGADTTDQVEAQYKQDSSAFWEDIKNAGLLRKFPNIKKHVQTRYHNCLRGHWSPDEDEHLRELAKLHPSQWKLIATHLNRRELDVYNRWKDYVRHGENRVTKRWSQDEEENFVDVLSSVCQKVEDHLAETGKPPLDDYTPVINWHEVCREMGDTRSRLQCQSKWKLMRAREPPATVNIEIKPRKTPQPGQEQEIPQKKRRKSRAKKKLEPAVETNLPGSETLLWGDKFDLITHVIEHVLMNGCETDSQIVWQDIAEKMKQTWSVRTLQTACKELRELVDEEETLSMTLKAVYAYVVENHEPELEERYIPADDLDVPLPDSSKKRKRQSVLGFAERSPKRNKAVPSTAKAYKSKEMITDSDNAESEPE